MGLITQPVPAFTDQLGRLLSAGYVYFGAENDDPEFDPITVYRDPDLTIPVAQPLRTSSGLLSDGVAPLNIYTAAANYSLRVRNTGGVEVLYIASVPSQTAGLTEAQLGGDNGASLVAWKRPDTAAVTKTVKDTLVATPRRVEEFGAQGGSANDVTAFSAAIDAVEETANPGLVTFNDPTGYRVTSTLTIDALRTSMEGRSVVNVDHNNTFLRVDCSQLSPAGNSYGQKGTLKGNVLAMGPGATSPSTSVGINFEGTSTYGAAQLLVENWAMYEFYYGYRFDDHGYNSLILKSEAFACDTCVYWPGDGADSGERNTFVGCAFYNSRIGIANDQPNGQIVSYGGSIDYTNEAVRTNGGRVFLTDMHLESNAWGPYAFYIDGNGGYLRMTGGTVLGMSNPNPNPYLGYVGQDARIDIDGSFIHNINLTRPNADSPTAFFIGPPNRSYVSIENTHSFEGSILPDRLHGSQTSLVDAGFETTIWPDLIWIAEDTAAVTSRRDGANIDIARNTAAGVPRSGSGCLSALKTGGSGSVARFGIMALPVKRGDKVSAGIHYRTDPARAGADANARRFSTQWAWAKLDRYDANGVPIFSFVELIGNVENPYVATNTWQMAVFSVSLAFRIAPPWATHFIGSINMFNANASTLLFDDIWCDRWS